MNRREHCHLNHMHSTSIVRHEKTKGLIPDLAGAIKVGFHLCVHSLPSLTLSPTPPGPACVCRLSGLGQSVFACQGCYLNSGAVIPPYPPPYLPLTVTQGTKCCQKGSHACGAGCCATHSQCWHPKCHSDLIMLMSFMN